MIEVDCVGMQQDISGLLAGFDGGELFLEHFQREAFSYRDRVLRSTDFYERKGFGLRAFVGDAVGFVHAEGFEELDVKKAIKSLEGFGLPGYGKFIASMNAPGESCYSRLDPLQQSDFASKADLLKTVDEYLRSKSPMVIQVIVNLVSSLQKVKIITPLRIVDDLRPMVKMAIMVVVKKGDRLESGMAGLGGRLGYDYIFEDWRGAADRALNQALTNLESVPIGAGEMVVVLGSGFPGVLLHEAVGHGLEGDANRKKSSAFSDLMGKQIASPGVTVVDDGTLWGRRGSISVDDEGMPSRYNVLIEDGILVGYMNDCINGKLLGGASTGNGRRESYSSLILPRMTNTYMLPGNMDPNEIIASVENGVYAVDFSDGQVDTTSGKFVFSASEAYLIEKGKISHPLNKITLIGSGPEVLKKISMIGNDMNLDSGTGLCGKDGQYIPVCVGQPTIKLDGITVGGSKG